jgi:hypothetical protein
LRIDTSRRRKNEDNSSPTVSLQKLCVRTSSNALNKFGLHLPDSFSDWLHSKEMGQGDDQKRKTIFSLVFSIVIHFFKNPSNHSVDKIIAQFFSRFGPLHHLNRGLRDYFDYNVQQRYFLRVLFLKVLLPIDILRSLHLAPPKGVSLDTWICFSGPCGSADKYRCQNIRVVEKIRKLLGHQDNLPPGYYRSFEKTWGNHSRVKPVNQSKRAKTGSFSPLLLFPVRSLPDKVKVNILRAHGRSHHLEGVLDNLFLCPDHFGPVPGVKLDLNLRSDSIFNYSFEYLLELLQSGKGIFRPGRKGWKHLPYLPTLISKCKNQPPFAEPEPVDESTLTAVRNLFEMNSRPFIDDLIDGDFNSQ